MSLVEDTGTALHWSVLTAKRPGLSRDIAGSDNQHIACPLLTQSGESQLRR
jgi:hypothetical protein